LGNALKDKDGATEGIPRALEGCYIELHHILNKINSEDGSKSHKKKLAWTFKQGEAKKTFDNLRRFHEQLTSAFLVDQTYVPA
jgi:hypothetical protein